MESFFFEFSSKYVSSTFMACYDDKINELNLIKGDYIDVNFPIIFKHEEGKKLTDILDTGYVGLFLISDKLKVFLEKNQLTGWKTFPIKIYDKKKIEISGYHGFSIIGRCKSIYYKRSSIFETQWNPTTPIIKYYKGLFINNWDGSDFFCLENKPQIFINKKTADLLKKEKITNLICKDLLEYEIRSSLIKEENLI